MPDIRIKQMLALLDSGHFMAISPRYALFVTRHRELYIQVREAAAERKANEEEARQLAAIAKVEGLARTLAQQGRRLTHRNIRALGLRELSPSSAEFAVFSLIRFGLGDRTARLPTQVQRLGDRFIKRVNDAIARLRAELEGHQLQLALSPD